MKAKRIKLITKITVVLFIVIVACIGTVYFLLSARRDSIEAGHQGMIRYVVGIQSLFYEREGGYAGSWEQLRDDLIANGTEITETGVQYRYTLEPAGDSLKGKNGGTVYVDFICIAEPVEYGMNGIRSFFVDSSGVIRYEYGKPASKNSDPI